MLCLLRLICASSVQPARWPLRPPHTHTQTAPHPHAPPTAGAIVAGDNFGRAHFFDPRMPQPIACLALHKKNGKVGCDL